MPNSLQQTAENPQIKYVKIEFDSVLMCYAITIESFDNRVLLFNYENVSGNITSWKEVLHILKDLSIPSDWPVQWAPEITGRADT